MESHGSESLTAEEIRQRRLAYFQSQSSLDHVTGQKQSDGLNKEETDIRVKRSSVIDEGKIPLKEKPVKNERSSDVRQTKPDLRLDLEEKKKDRNEEGYSEEVEKLIQMTKKEMAGKYSGSTRDSSSRETTAKQPSLSTVEGKSAANHSNKPKDLRGYRPQPSNDMHVEDIFSGRNNSSSRQRPGTGASVKESHDNGAYSYFLKSVDGDQVEELGLSTHRPEDGSKERSPRALDESMSEELKYALGEKKYKEFLEKSIKDIDALYGDNIKNKTKVDKLEKSATKDINLRREQFDKVTSSLMGRKTSEAEMSVNNEIDRKREDTEGNRPLLNRPKHEPSSIYQNKRDAEENNLSRYNRSKSMEDAHVLSSRNFAFSADEIYSQAYQPQVINSTSMSISGGEGIGHGHPIYRYVSSQAGAGHVGQSQPFPRGFQPQPSFFHSHSYDGSNPHGQYYPPDFMVPQSPSGYFVPHPYGNHGSYPVRTPRQTAPSASSREHSHPYMQHPHPQHAQYEDAHSGHSFSARNVHKMDQQDIYRFQQQHPQMFPHPPEGHGLDQEFKPHPPATMGKSPPYYHHEKLPHPPESPTRPGPHGDMAAFQDYLHMMPKGIPYPPPPSDIELQAYFQFLGSQGYPIPYHNVMPPDSPKDDQDYRFRYYGRPAGMMIPHPPAEKKDTKPGSGHFRRREYDSSPRRPSNQEEVHETDERRIEGGKRSADEGRSEELNSSQRHIDGIRQYHEQRRQQQENEMLEKQRVFAKESIDRYFSSLEHHSSKRNSDMNDKPMEILRESLSDVQTMVNSEATGVTLNAGGITERMDELGIDLSYLKGKEETENSYKNKGEKVRNVIVCPECGEVNKPYMTWCSECSEVLIGVDPVKVKPKRKGGRLKKTEESNDKNYVLYKNVTFDEQTNKSSKHIDSENEDIEKDHERPRVKSSPSKSDGKDSGRPSTEDLDFSRTEHEIDEICQSLSDPVIKGFIKAYFNKKRQELSKKDEYSLNSDREHIQEEVSQEGPEERISPDEQFGTDDQDHDEYDENIHYEDNNDNNVGNGFVDSNLLNSYPHPIESHSPVEHEHHHEHHHFHNEDIWLHERRKEKRETPLGKHHLPIDIEIFTMEESRQGKSSQRDPLVPSLNLANSSDEEDTLLQKKKPFIPLSMSAESDDWQEFFKKEQQIDVPYREPPFPESLDLAGEEEEEKSKPFLAQLLDHQPKVSKRPPSASNTSKTKKSHANAKSVVKESIDAPLRQRKWARSSTAWSSYNKGELSTKSSIGASKSRPSSAGSKRPSSGVTKSTPSAKSVDVPRRSDSMHNLSIAVDKPPSDLSIAVDKPPSDRRKGPTINRPADAQLSVRSVDSDDSPSPVNPARHNSPERQVKKKETSLAKRKDSAHNREQVQNKESPKSLPYVIDHRLPLEDIEPVKDVLKLQSAYSMYQEMTPRIQDGTFSPWLCLPDEIMLQIFQFLSHSDLLSVGLSCKRYYRVALDETLWRYITIKKKHHMDDDTLVHIGHRHPVSLALIQCHGDNITAKGLRELFRECCEKLRELNLCGCSRGALTGDCILLHASARCHNLTHIDASWCMVTDSGIGAISSSCKRLESLCINGCQNVSDEGLETVIKKHGQSLRVLEMFGCFKISPKGIRYLANHCINLLTLNLGQCYKLKDSCIAQLSASLGRIESLDLRGVKNIKDNCIRYVVKNCPRLKTIVMANCPNISDVALLEISTYLSDIRVIDVCGCRNVTDNSIRALSNNCQNLRNIDISSTGCTHRSVSMLANFCNQRLEVAKLNFLADVTESVVMKLVKHCKRLKLLHLYSCSCVKDLKKIQEVNTQLKIEM